MLALPEETVNQIVGYLGTRPYAEVVNLIVNIQNQAKLVTLQDSSSKEKSDKKDKKTPTPKQVETPTSEKKD